MEAALALTSDRLRESAERAERQLEAHCLRADSRLPDSSGWSRRALAQPLAGVLTGKLDAVGLLFGALALVAWGTGKLVDGRTVAVG